jgi:hypothetical protein
MILIIRGHIRNSFDNKNLYHLIRVIYEKYSDVKIYIHTWRIFSNNISWRHINTNENIVNERIIHDYFGDLSHLIKHIIIDDDKKITLIGKTDGLISGTKMPTIGWKNYWYGKYNIINYIYNNRIDENEMIVNFRFDINTNSYGIDNERILNFIRENHKSVFTKNVFLKDVICGVDNIYIGNLNTMYKLTRKFYYELDDILIRYPDIFHQEQLVCIVNRELLIDYFHYFLEKLIEDMNSNKLENIIR